MPDTQTLTADAPQATYREDYRPPGHLVPAVDLQFDLGEEFTTVRARLQVRRNPQAEPGPLVLFGDELTLLSVSLDGVPIPPERYEVTDERLVILDPPENCVVETEVRIHPQENTRLEGLYLSRGMFCTQCEAEGFRRITYYPDRPDVMARFTTTITADKERYPVLLSNGNLVESGDLPLGRHLAKWEDPFPKPSYLFALVAGRLEHLEDRFKTRSGREVTLRVFSEPRNMDKCAYALSCLKKAMKWDEERFGREYDLDLFMVVAVDDFNFGAMENKGLNIFNSKFVLARPDTATDEDFEKILGVVGHEYFHNWTGNRVTCRDWFQLSLKEGLTIFRDQSFSSDLTSPAIRRIDEVEFLRSKQFPEDAGPMAHSVRPESYIEIGNFYTVTVYWKGAEVVRMYETIVGPAGFRKGMDLYFERHDGQAVTCDDFRAAIADANGRDLEQFGRWYSQAGTPVLEAIGQFDPASGIYTLMLSQSCPATPGQPEKDPFVIPVALGFLGRDGRPLPVQLEGEDAAAGTGTRVLTLDRPTQSFRFVGLEAEPVPSILRGFSAPVKLRMRQSREELALLWEHDPDDFNRYEAGRRLATEVLLEQVAAFQAGRELELDPVFAEAFGRNLTDGPQDLALRAVALVLPPEDVLAEEMEAADPAAIHAARRFLRRTLAERFRADFERLHRACRSEEDYRLDPAAVARRRLGNVCLAYLGALEGAEARRLCQAQLRAADNMTDELAAMAVLADLEGPEREAAFAQFYDRWKNEDLVLDKWFMLQAASSLPGTLARVEELSEHPEFQFRNPNRVRALVGTFSLMNPARFHAEGGAGHVFLADVVLKVDPLNPALASRLARAFTRWRNFRPEVAESMRAQLQRILDSGPSKDLFEIVSKSLEA